MKPMQRCTLALIVAIVGLFFTHLTSALGLGEITLKSSLNEPLDAEIRLLQVRDLSKSEIVIGLASREAFQRAGVERVFFLNDITFNVDLSDRSAPVIRLRSQKSVAEPYLNFLLEVQWPSGRLLREYTLLMDLPVYDSDSSSGNVSAPQVTPKEQVVAPAPSKAKKASPSFTTRTAPVNSAPSSAGTSTAAKAESTLTEYQVVAGDTLWEIALKARPDNSVAVHQSMLAIQRTNPDAFIKGNINMLRKGEILRFPTKKEMQSISAEQAISEVARQNQQWSSDRSATGAVLKGDSKPLQSVDIPSSKPEGRLKLSAIDNASTSTAKVSGVGGTGKSLENKLIAAQEELDRARQENVEYSERVEQLEAQIETMEKLIAVSNDKLRALQLAASKKDELNTPANEIPSNTDVTLQTRGAVDDVTDDQQTEPSTEVAETSDATTTETTEVTSPVASSAETIESSLPSDKIEQPVAPPPVVESGGGIINTLKANIPYIAGAVVALLFFIVLLMRFRNKDNDDELEAIDEMDSFDEDQIQHEDNITEESVEEIDHSVADDMLDAEESQFEDPLNDDVDAVDTANIFISLGQYDQAEQQLLREIETNPDNINARLNLLKVYSETQNISEFDVQYAQLLPMGDISINEKAKALRDEIPGAGEFDVSHYGVEDHLDTDSGQQLSTAPTSDDGLSMDFDKELTEDQSLFDDEKHTDDTELEENNQTYADLSSTEDEEDAFSEMSLNMDNLSDDDMQSDKIPAEDILNVEDNLEDHSDELETIAIDGLDSQQSVDNIDELTAIEPVSQDTDNLDLGAGDDSDLSEPASIDFGQEALDLQSSSDEIDMESLDKEISSIIDDQPEDTDDYADQLTLDDDLGALDDDADEVATKLDLALAYLDMGDGEGAKDILSEVIEEGTPEQQEKARSLLDSV